ncbi:MAG: tRNA (adenosine(37)-N6)-threonylcarbamoyltransferase complex dimerization subunit type 1 TsaB [Proteobacteria bacterium]|nr:tRNA (adenosine(37)-N6)-threonylcarbamoyltransferase complex dimerization subunit type 1 TsaB [Pseudomonadota bacterium]
MLLAINTATPQFSIALMSEGGTLVAESVFFGGSSKFRPLMPALHHLLGSARTDIKQLTTLAVVTGPGSFTGLRIGLSVAKGICQGLQIPIIGLSSLKAMASQVPYTPYTICPVIDSRKGEIFSALFRWSDDEGRVTRITEDTCFRVEELHEFAKGSVLFVGNDIQGQGPAIREAVGHRALLAPPHLWALRASAVGFVALEQAREKGVAELHRLVPSYLRPPDIGPNLHGPALKREGATFRPGGVLPLTKETEKR